MEWLETFTFDNRMFKTVLAERLLSIEFFCALVCFLCGCKADHDLQFLQEKPLSVLIPLTAGSH